MSQRNPNITCEFTEADWEFWYARIEREKQQELNHQKSHCIMCGKRIRGQISSHMRKFHLTKDIEFEDLKSMIKYNQRKYQKIQDKINKIIRRIRRLVGHNRFQVKSKRLSKIWREIK